MSLVSTMSQISVERLLKKYHIDQSHLHFVWKAFDEGATVPFLARYRKEQTGGMNDRTLLSFLKEKREIEALEARRHFILSALSSAGVLTPDLEDRIRASQDRHELEDLYEPYRPKKESILQKAQSWGLVPFIREALRIGDWCQHFEVILNKVAEICHQLDPYPSVEEQEEATKHLIASLLVEPLELRRELRHFLWDSASFRSTVKKRYAGEKTRFSDYYDFSNPVKTIKSHVLLALRRGYKMGVLKLDVVYDMEEALNRAKSYYQRETSLPIQHPLFEELLKLGLQTYLFPVLVTDIRLETKKRADEEALKMYEHNIRQILLQPPLKVDRVLAIDPGFKSGCKYVLVNHVGEVLETGLFFITGEQKEVSQEQFLAFLKHIQPRPLVAIGNGKGGRDVLEWLEESGILKELDLQCFLINEAGASIYSASEIAQQEFPDLDVTLRSAVTLARRVLDPLSELVKLDPKHLGVGQYQHDVNQKRLREELESVVSNAVNYVGVNLNTASASLLRFVSGLNESVAHNIVEYRQQHGPFKKKEELRQVPGVGPVTFEQAVGFLRIPDSPDLFDYSRLLPEHQAYLEYLSQELGIPWQDLPRSSALSRVDVERLREHFHLHQDTVSFILRELQNPGFDPRLKRVSFRFHTHVRKLEDLKPGLKVRGFVTNLTRFGAFVDIGVGQDGLVHMKDISYEYVHNIEDVLHVGQVLDLWVKEVEIERKRIGLTLKDPEHQPAPKPQAARAYHKHKKNHFTTSQTSERDPEKAKKASLDELLSKFSSHRL